MTQEQEAKVEVKEKKTDAAKAAPVAEGPATAATESAPSAEGKAAGKKKKKVKKAVSEGLAFIKATFNNTLITITDKTGNVVCWGSAGASGFKGSKKSTPFAAQIAAEAAAIKARDAGMRSVDVFVSGPGAGRETALKAIGKAGIQIRRIQDVTPIPHNGCRPPKKRRV